MKKSPLFSLFLTVFIDLLGFGIVIPLLPFYAEHFHADYVTIGVLTAVYSVMQFVFSPLWGALSDRIGRRPVLMISLAGTAIALTLFGLANSLPMLFLARAMSGITSATISTAQAYVADVTTPENRAKGMGLIGAAFGIGFVFGPAIGGGFSHWGGHETYWLPAFIGAGLAVFNLALTAAQLPESHPAGAGGFSAAEARRFSGPRLGQALRAPTLGTLLAIFFFATVGFSAMETTFALLAQRRLGFDSAAAGWFFGYVGILIVLMQGGLVGRLAKRLGEVKLVVSGTLAMAIGLALLPYAPGVVPTALVMAVLAFGQGVCGPSLSSLISKVAPADQKGSILGVSQSVGSLGRILGPLVGGAALAMRLDLPYLLGGGLMLAMFLLALRLPSGDPKSSELVGAQT